MADQGERADTDSFIHPPERRAALLSVLRALQWSCPTSVLQNCSSHLQVSISSGSRLPARARWCVPWVTFCVRKGKKLRSPA